VALADRACDEQTSRPMSKPQQDKRRLVLENYPLRFETRSLYSDVDTNRHVNNVAYGRWFEESRVQLNERVAGTGSMLNPPPGVQLLLASIHIEYLRQIPYPSTVTVAAAVSVIHGASYGIAHAVFHDSQCAAVGDSIVVRAQDGRPTRLTDRERAALSPYGAFG
jgi:acyl-CoA thioester hydrolase